jgi:hypothetical protein
MIAFLSVLAITGFSFTIFADEAFSTRDLDRDKDGILDDFDECPQIPETYNKFQDADGCPDKVPEEVKTPYQFPDSEIEKTNV